jgi:predicted DNA-binding transcriptional regulator YafY
VLISGELSCVHESILLNLLNLLNLRIVPMRADRLISLLLLLQSRGRLTAQELARELEVSERTIYRDIEALSASGVPVYAEAGPGGGCALLDSYRTTLTGLNHDEVRALFSLCLSAPAPLARVGMSQPLKSATLKLSAALAAGQRNDEILRQRIHLDSTPWFATDEPAPCLQTLYDAVWQSCRLRLVRRVHFAGFIDAELEHKVEPYGLVAKASVWHLVCRCEGDLRVYRAAHITAAHRLDEAFERPASFDLAAFWARWCESYERSRPQFQVVARVAPALLPLLQQAGNGFYAGPAQGPDPQGWHTLILTFETLFDARSRLLAWGGDVEALEPPELRLSMADFAAQIASRYKGEI